MKLIKALVVMLVAVGMILPAVAIAEDRLSLSGEMRVRAFHVDVDSADNTETWANQRLRIAGKIAVAEGVSVTFRTDITEGTDWGDSSSFGSGFGNPERSNGFGHARGGSQQQWDRAHLDITKGIFSLRAGQQYVGTGGVWAVDTQDSGLRVDVKTSVPVTAYFIVDNNNAEAGGADFILDTDETSGTYLQWIENPDASANTSGKSTNDAYLWGVTVSPKFGETSTKFFYAGYDDGREENVTLLGASAKMALGPVNLFGEFDYFTGDANDAAGVDAFGTQLMLDGSMAASDMITVGAQFFYAAGDDEDEQYVLLGNGFNGWDPINDVGTSLSNEEISFNRPFDFTGQNAGVVGGNIYGSFKVSDALTLGAKAGWYGVEEDAITDEELTAIAGGLVYSVAENTTFQLQLQYWDLDEADDDVFAAGSGIFVKF